ncbi:hypothetical protein BGZ83_003748 [Gryganskiella cystojenkinii]|nr:hypothetical protein BGZ83_003748 [Gryganskiella cystojenkinii]
MKSVFTIASLVTLGSLAMLGSNHHNVVDASSLAPFAMVGHSVVDASPLANLDKRQQGSVTTGEAWCAVFVKACAQASAQVCGANSQVLSPCNVTFTNGVCTGASDVGCGCTPAGGSIKSALKIAMESTFAATNGACSDLTWTAAPAPTSTTGGASPPTSTSASAPVATSPPVKNGASKSMMSQSTVAFTAAIALGLSCLSHVHPKGSLDSLQLDGRVGPGVAIGMGMRMSHKANSVENLIVMGVADSIACGVLLYIAFVTVLGGDILYSERFRTESRTSNASYLVAVWLFGLWQSIFSAEIQRFVRFANLNESQTWAVLDRAHRICHLEIDIEDAGLFLMGDDPDGGRHPAPDCRNLRTLSCVDFGYFPQETMDTNQWGMVTGASKHKIDPRANALCLLGRNPKLETLRVEYNRQYQYGTRHFTPTVLDALSSHQHLRRFVLRLNEAVVSELFIKDLLLCLPPQLQDLEIGMHVQLGSLPLTSQHDITGSGESCLNAGCRGYHSSPERFDDYYWPMEDDDEREDLTGLIPTLLRRSGPSLVRLSVLSSLNITMPVTFAVKVLEECPNLKEFAALPYNGRSFPLGGFLGSPVSKTWSCTGLESLELSVHPFVSLKTDKDDGMNPTKQIVLYLDQIHRFYSKIKMDTPLLQSLRLHWDLDWYCQPLTELSLEEALELLNRDRDGKLRPTDETLTLKDVQGFLGLPWQTEKEILTEHLRQESLELPWIPLPRTGGVGVEQYQLYYPGFLDTGRTRAEPQWTCRDFNCPCFYENYKYDYEDFWDKVVLGPWYRDKKKLFKTHRTLHSRHSLRARRKSYR